MDKRVCPETFKEISACPMYYYEIFNQYPSVVTTEVDEYLHIIKNYSDPILRYIALYLIYNYKHAQELFTGTKNYQDDLACYNLNRWLDQSKSFFTHSQKSSSNASLWKIYIENLWETLDSQNKGIKCPRKEYFSNTTQIPEELGFVMEYEKYPDDYICYDPLEENHTVILGDCYKLNELCSECENLRVLQEKSSNSKAPHQEICLTLYKSLQISQLEVPESCGACPSLIRMLSFPVFVTFSGTLFIAFFLYKFTSLGAKLSNRRMRKKRLNQMFDEEEAYAQYERFRNNNPYLRSGMNHLHYQSLYD
ncbi:VIR protein [Plasmodium vivax]|uniref:VIR protein n=1 Tax=Plasmodium vivax TaxID=5855 RepID=A0A1G4HC57_PLAVI|nr:VIR protein [Plasmodium vivax]